MLKEAENEVKILEVLTRFRNAQKSVYFKEKGKQEAHYD